MRHRFSEEHRARLRARMATFQGRNEFHRAAVSFEDYVYEGGSILNLNPFITENSYMRTHSPTCVHQDQSSL